MKVYLVNVVNLKDNSEQVDSIYTGDEDGYRWAQERSTELETELSSEFSVEINSFPVVNETYA